MKGYRVSKHTRIIGRSVNRGAKKSRDDRMDVSGVEGNPSASSAAGGEEAWPEETEEPWVQVGQQWTSASEVANASD